MKSGEWIVFDEINACPADVLFALHSLLDDDKKITLIEKDGEVIRPHKDFRFFATMNPIEDYAGTKELNMAFFSRFGSVIKIKPFGVDIEINILQRKGVSITVATRLVSMANNLRQHKKNDDIIFFCGTRDLIHTGKLMHQGMQESNAIHYGILNKMSKDDKAFVLSKNINLIVPDPLVQKLTNEILDLNNKYAQSLVDKSVQENQIKNLQQNLQQAQQAQAVDQYNLSDDIKKALKILGIL